MATMTMLDLRKNSDILLEKLKKKEKITLSYRGKPIATIEPIQERVDWKEDTFVQFIEDMNSHKPPQLPTLDRSNGKMLFQGMNVDQIINHLKQLGSV